MTRTLFASALLGAIAASTALAQTQTAPQTARPPAPNAATPQTAAPARGTTSAAPPAGAAPAAAATAPNPAVGGVAMDPTKPIPVNAAAAPTLSTLVSAMKAAGVDATLSGPGPFTVFAPTNEAFGRLAPADLANLMKPANKPSLVKLLTYHVVPGTITLADLQERMKAGGGKTTLTSVEGEPLVVTLEGGAISLTDVGGHKSYLQVPDVRQSNGVVHVVNGVLLPTFG